MKETLRAKFLAFLEKDVRIKDAAQRELYVDFAETKLPEFIRQHLDINYEGLYENTDRTYYDCMRRHVYRFDTGTHSYSYVGIMPMYTIPVSQLPHNINKVKTGILLGFRAIVCGTILSVNYLLNDKRYEQQDFDKCSIALPRCVP